ncbi:hypothetical protein [Paracoccus sp. SY]|uniref:hypothetical protein n=1 Tax=Paracoccus sp. SY TaxID=1330255 RepID=UPI000CD2471F|nr:hypothetical protein [Paracoccus sp. SY]
MSDREEWSEWRLHDGMSRPVPAGTWVETEDRWGEINQDFAEAFDETTDMSGCWVWEGDDELFGVEIVRYRVRTPRALQQLREMIETLPAPRQKEDA